AERGRLVHGGQDAIDFCFAEHVRKVYMPVLSRPRDCITKRVRQPTLDGCPAKEDAESRTVGAPRSVVSRVFIELSNMPGRNATELGHAGPLQVQGKRR